VAEALEKFKTYGQQNPGVLAGVRQAS